MRETFPVKRPGDSLAASHVNRLGSVLRREAAGSPGSYLVGGGGVAVDSPGFVGVPVAIESETAAARYDAQVRWRDHYSKVWQTDTDNNSIEVDSSDLGRVFQQGVKPVVYWDEQRRMHVPVSRGVDVPIDLRADSQSINESGEGLYTIRFCLEQWTGSEWRSVNRRICAVNGARMSLGGSVSSTGIYTLVLTPATPMVILRLTALSDLNANVILDFAAARFVVRRGGVEHSLGSPLSDATPVVFAGIESIVTAAFASGQVVPAAALVDSLIYLTVPVGETWTVKAEVACRFSVLEVSSSFSSSSSSCSSSSKSSMSSSSYSSPSSSSHSTSSSSSSQSSQSSQSSESSSSSSPSSSSSTSSQSSSSPSSYSSPSSSSRSSQSSWSSYSSQSSSSSSSSSSTSSQSSSSSSSYSSPSSSSYSSQSSWSSWSSQSSSSISSSSSSSTSSQSSSSASSYSSPSSSSKSSISSWSSYSSQSSSSISSSSSSSTSSQSSSSSSSYSSPSSSSKSSISSWSSYSSQSSSSSSSSSSTSSQSGSTSSSSQSSSSSSGDCHPCCGRNLPIVPVPTGCGGSLPNWPNTMHITVTPRGNCACAGTPIEFDVEWTGTFWENEGPISTGSGCGGDINYAYLVCGGTGPWTVNFVWGNCNDGGVISALVDMDADDDGECEDSGTVTGVSLGTNQGCCGRMLPPFSNMTVDIEVST